MSSADASAETEAAGTSQPEPSASPAAQQGRQDDDWWQWHQAHDDYGNSWNRWNSSGSTWWRRPDWGADDWWGQSWGRWRQEHRHEQDGLGGGPQAGDGSATMGGDVGGYTWERDSNERDDGSLGSHHSGDGFGTRASFAGATCTRKPPSPTASAASDEAGTTRTPLTSGMQRTTSGSTAREEAQDRVEYSRGPSEKMVVPTFGGTPNEGDELGATARSYLRQIAAWRKMTRLPVQQQALVLYQNLTNRAWVEAERLSVDKLASSEGIAYFEDWIKERYLDVQVTQIGRSLSEFFRKLRKKPGQSIRDYIGEFDRAHARLVECGCHLPDLASAWVFVDRMELEESSELNLLASVNNTYDLQKLQRAAIVHDRALRKPWESQKGDGKGGRWWKGRPQVAHITEDGDFNENEADPFGDEGEAMSEEIATELYETYMTHEAAKNKYREHNKLRGASPGALRRISEEKMRLAKARSFCAGCKRKGHWHRDAECPLNQGNHGKTTTPAATTTPSTTAGTSGTGQTGMGGHKNYQCHVVHVTWDLGETPPKELNAITDTACSRSVAGAPWLERYLKVTAELGYKPQFLGGRESFKFGASKIFDSKYSVVIAFQMGDYVLQVRTAIVEGDVPLLLSKPTLGAMGMIYDVARNRANFTSLELCDFPLSATETGHPAIPFIPVQAFAGLPQDWEANEPEIKISKSGAAYKGVWEAHMTNFGILGDPQHHEATPPPLAYDQRLVEINNYRIFYPKKLPPATRNMLLDRDFHEGSFLNWWKTTSISQDFWIEGPEHLVRVHVVPRRSFFSPMAWGTSDQGLKNDLLNALGYVRHIHGISCSMHRALNPVHGTWRDHDDQGCFPVLWIGRTVFSRSHMSKATSRTSSEHGASTRAPEDQHMAHEQDGAARRGHALRIGSEPDLESRRDQVDHCGAPCSREGEQ